MIKYCDYCNVFAESGRYDCAICGRHSMIVWKDYGDFSLCFCCKQCNRYWTKNVKNPSCLNPKHKHERYLIQHHLPESYGEMLLSTKILNIHCAFDVLWKKIEKNTLELEDREVSLADAAFSLAETLPDCMEKRYIVANKNHVQDAIDKSNFVKKLRNATPHTIGLLKDFWDDIESKKLDDNKCKEIELDELSVVSE